MDVNLAPTIIELTSNICMTEYMTCWDPSHHVLVIKNLTYAQNAIMYAMASTIACEWPAVGFDLEWVAGKKSRKTMWPSTIQLSFSHITLILLPFYMEGIPSALRILLNAPNIHKVGVGITNDALIMARAFDACGRGYVELSMMAWTVAWDKLPVHRDFNELVSLQQLALCFADMHLVKFKEVPQWDANDLPLHLIAYAAADSYASLKVSVALQAELAVYSGVLPEEEFPFYWTFTLDESHKALDLNGDRWRRTPPFDRQTSRSHLIGGAAMTFAESRVKALEQENKMLRVENEMLKMRIASSDR